MPRELAEHADRAAVVAECHQVLATAHPAQPEQFAVIIERLALHYPENRLTPKEQVVVLEDWRRLLGHLPAHILSAAADAHIMSPARFFPTPGQLNTHADYPWRLLQRYADRARATLKLIEGAS